MKTKSKKSKSITARTKTKAGYLKSKCPSCRNDFRHVSEHRISCIRKKIEEGQPDKFFIPNTCESYEKKCDMCFLILTKKHFKKHETKDCRVLTLRKMFENGDINFDEFKEIVESIRKTNYLKSRCKYCTKRVIDKNMPKHLKTCNGFKKYKKLFGRLQKNKEHWTCERYNMIKKRVYKSMEVYYMRKAEFDEKKNIRFVEKLEEQRNQINPNRSNGLPPISIKKDIDYYLPKQIQDRINFNVSNLNIKTLKVSSSSQKQPSLSNEEFQKQYKEAMWKNDWQRFEGFKIFQRNPGYILHHQNKTIQKEFTIVYTSELDGSNIQTKHFTRGNNMHFTDLDTFEI